jgi:protease IV
MDEWTVDPKAERRRAPPPGPEQRRANASDNADAGWERQALRDIALEGIAERRRARRWSIAFRLVFLGLFVLSIGLTQGWFQILIEGRDPGKHTAVVRVNGVIGAGGESNAEDVIGALRAAYEDTATQGVILHVNSPGGSPVHAAQINEAIAELRAAHAQVPLYVVADDVFASAAYYLAVSADAIYVNPATIVGSIGVLYNGFGFERAIDTLGIERRLYTAGASKAALDPFSPVDAQAVAELQTLLDEVHALFIDAVKTGRGERLRASDEMLYSGRVWTGAQGVEIGLADGFGRIDQVARDVIGAERRVDFTPRRSLLDELVGRASHEVTHTVLRAWGGSADGGLRLR